MTSVVDLSILLSYLGFVFSVGLWLRRRAGANLESYFLAGRSLPAWWLGTSMVATTFAADTPLAVTGIVATHGVAGNWLWWSWIFTFSTITIFFARSWRRSHVLTDVELVNLRYDGRLVPFLRSSKAVYLGLILNAMTLGWVFHAMTSITRVFFNWQKLLPAGVFHTLESYWPQALVIGSVNESISIATIFLLIMLYSAMGGIRGVVFTDLVQFVLGLAGALILAAYALYEVGGLAGLQNQLQELYSSRASEYTSLFPLGGNSNSLFSWDMFFIYIGLMWWARFDSDGTGYLAQRMQAARSARDAQFGALWFSLAHFALRSWPWIIVALTSLVLFPLGDPDQSYKMGALMQTSGENVDREVGYVLVAKLLLPAGLLGLFVTSLVAAFMSTVDTHLNWGSSYLVNDLYRPLRRKLSRDPDSLQEKEFVAAGRASVFFLAVISFVVASYIESIASAWKVFISLASGLGFAQLLRWFWWRATAVTELAGIFGGFVFSLLFYYWYPDQKQEYVMLGITLCAVFTCLMATFFSRPVNREQLYEFAEKVRPVGYWPSFPVSNALGLVRLRQWIYMILCCSAGLFAPGFYIRGDLKLSIGAALLFGSSLYLLIWSVRNSAHLEER